MGTVVYRDATIFDGTGAALSAAGRSSSTATGSRRWWRPRSWSVPDGAEVVELAGRFVIPGLIDSHQHLATPPDRVQAEAWLRRMLYGGVTAIRDMADDLRADRRPHPRLPGRRDPRPGHPLRRPGGRPELLRRPAHLAGLPGRDAGDGALDAGDHRRDRPRDRHRPGPRHACQRAQDLRRPVVRAGRRDHRRGTPAGRARVGARLCLPGAAARRGALGRRRRLTRHAAGLADPGDGGADVQEQDADRPGHDRSRTILGSTRCWPRCSSAAPSSTRPQACGRATRCSARPRTTLPRWPGRRQRPALGGTDGACLRRRRADLRGQRLRDGRGRPVPRAAPGAVLPPRAVRDAGRRGAAIRHPDRCPQRRRRGRPGHARARQARQLRGPRPRPDRRPAQPRQRLVHGQARRPAPPLRLRRRRADDATT